MAKNPLEWNSYISEVIRLQSVDMMQAIIQKHSTLRYKFECLDTVLRHVQDV